MQSASTYESVSLAFSEISTVPFALNDPPGSIHIPRVSSPCVTAPPDRSRAIVRFSVYPAAPSHKVRPWLLFPLIKVLSLRKETFEPIPSASTAFTYSPLYLFSRVMLPPKKFNFPPPETYAAPFSQLLAPSIDRVPSLIVIFVSFPPFAFIAAPLPTFMELSPVNTLSPLIIGVVTSSANATCKPYPPVYTYTIQSLIRRLLLPS